MVLYNALLLKKRVIVYSSKLATLQQTIRWVLLCAVYGGGSVPWLTSSCIACC